MKVGLAGESKVRSKLGKIADRKARLPNEAIANQMPYHKGKYSKPERRFHTTFRK